MDVETIDRCRGDGRGAARRPIVQRPKIVSQPISAIVKSNCYRVHAAAIDAMVDATLDATPLLLELTTLL